MRLGSARKRSKRALAISHDGEVLFAGLTDTGEILRVEPAQGTADLWQAHATNLDTASGSSGWIHEVRLLPGEDELVTTGPDGWLRRWEADTGTEIHDPISVGWTLVNENLYASSWTFSPTAGSPDGTLLVTLDDEGVLVLRRSCDGEILADLPIPVNPNRGAWEEDVGAVAVAFSPGGEAIGVRYEGSVGLWQIRD